MAVRTSKSILIAVVLWLVIFGLIAAAVRYLVIPRYENRTKNKLVIQTGSEGKYKHVVRLAADSFSSTLR